METKKINDDTEIYVCDSCLTAACWLGELMCESAISAGIVLKSVRELKKLDLEHESYWEKSVTNG